jgi:hypothetical protein
MQQLVPELTYGPWVDRKSCKKSVSQVVNKRSRQASLIRLTQIIPEYWLADARGC